MTDITLHQAVQALETLYPLRYAESWDEPGLILGRPDWPVRKIYCAVDPTMAVVQEAIDWGADLLFTHHPLLFRAVHTVAATGHRGEIITRLTDARCGLWVGHTNADAAWRGQAMAALDAFGLTDEGPLIPIDDPTAPGPVGTGRIGRLETPLALADFARRVAAALPPTNLGVLVAGDLQAPVSRIALLPGSGDSLFDDVRRARADAYVTSDLRHHPALDAIEQARHEASLRSRGIMVGAGGDPAAGTRDQTPRPALINTPHSAIERLLFRFAMTDVPARIEGMYGAHVEMGLSATRTDPWDARF